MTIRCVWCGWEGPLDDLDEDSRDEPAYCPECGRGTFDIRSVDLRETRLEEKDHD